MSLSTTTKTIQVIQKLPAWHTLSAEAVHQAITQPQRLAIDGSIWSIAGISREFGAPVGEAVYAAILAAGLPGLATRFATVGLDASDEQWLAVADQLQASLPEIAEHFDQLKWIGFDRRSIWQTHSDSDPPTVEDVRAALTDETNRVRLINATALFSERMAIDADPSAVWTQAWEDAGL